jgi:spore coat polysaccharide biosynthesis protein SpsF (cytidylyltransferase family)/sialic acid synthase SpsE
MYTILEVANTHGGNISYLKSLIDEFSDISENVGIKFQPFKYSEIALEDFEWYSVYEKLYFNVFQWREIISKAAETKDVWLDIFDSYGIEILKNNLDIIHGVKFQTSVLDNQSVMEKFMDLNLNGKKLIINIASREIEDIKNKIKFFEKKNELEEILLEVGFQAYPTELIDSGISKLKTLKSLFSNKIVFADHIDGKDINAKILPLIAINLGVDVIEKHIMHSEFPTEYDHFSSLDVNGIKDLINLMKQYDILNGQPFINNAEKAYYEKSIQIPVFKNEITCNETLSMKDFNFKRTDLDGLSYFELKNLISEGNIILNKSKTKNEIIQIDDLIKANVACIVAARLKSSRLKEKAKLKIGKLSSLELCLKNCLTFRNVDKVFLATSTVPQDNELIKYKYSEDVIFHQGDPDDVIQRYLDIVRKYKIDVFIRVTGDMPFVSIEITDYLLKDHFLSGADYTVAKDFAVGTSVEIINSSALEKVKSYFPNAEYSEYMTWYFQNNENYFNLNFVDLPEKFVRNYRLTIDYKEDLDMFNHIQKHFDSTGNKQTIENIFKFLDENKNIANINSHLNLKYKTDKNLIDKLNNYTKIK